MNNWLGVVTLLFILTTTLAIYLKHRKPGNVIWSIFRFVIVVCLLLLGHDATQVWEVLLYNILIGGCLLISFLHAYNKLFASDAADGTFMENRKPRPFGNGYWR